MASVLIIGLSSGPVAAALRTEGHLVMEAADERRGMQIMHSRKPDCLVLDVKAPNSGDFTMLKTLIDETTAPVIAVTEDVRVSVQKRLLALGAAVLLHKPARHGEVLAAVREVLSTQGKGAAVKQATNQQMDALREFLNIGVGKAASSLNSMVNHGVTLEVPFIRILTPLQFKHETADLGSQTLASVRIGFYGPFSGTAALVMSRESGSKLADVLTDRAADAAESGSVMQETLREVGNIVVNGVLGSLGNILDQQISYSLPKYSEMNIKNLFFSEKVGNNTVFLLVRTRFKIRRIEVEGNIILLFTVAAFDALLAAIDRLK